MTGCEEFSPFFDNTLEYCVIILAGSLVPLFLPAMQKARDSAGTAGGFVSMGAARPAPSKAPAPRTDRQIQSDTQLRGIGQGTISHEQTGKSTEQLAQEMAEHGRATVSPLTRLALATDGKPVEDLRRQAATRSGQKHGGTTRQWARATAPAETAPAGPGRGMGMGGGGPAAPAARPEQAPITNRGAITLNFGTDVTTQYNFRGVPAQDQGRIQVITGLDSDGDAETRYEVLNGIVRVTEKGEVAFFGEKVQVKEADVHRDYQFSEMKTHSGPSVGMSTTVIGGTVQDISAPKVSQEGAAGWTGGGGVAGSDRYKGEVRRLVGSGPIHGRRIAIVTDGTSAGQRLAGPRSETEEHGKEEALRAAREAFGDKDSLVPVVRRRFDSSSADSPDMESTDGDADRFRGNGRQGVADLKLKVDALDTGSLVVLNRALDDKELHAVRAAEVKRLTAEALTESGGSGLAARPDAADKAGTTVDLAPRKRDLAEAQHATSAEPSAIVAGQLAMTEEVSQLPKKKHGRAAGVADEPGRPEPRRAYLARKNRQAPDDDQDGLALAATFKVGPVNPFVMTEKDRWSTFALDVDTASYSVARNYIRKGYLPPPASVRMEEFINAFDYNYSTRSDRAFEIHSATAPSPFGKGLTMVKVGVKGRVIGRDMRKAAHLVFVIDTSGSMAREDRIPFVQHGLKLLAGQLHPADRVSVVTYGTKASLVLEAVSGKDRNSLRATIDSLQCQGSTNLVEGLALGYEVAVQNFIPGQINRVILLSDGVANIGATEGDAILSHVESYRGHGITFTSVGFGGGSYNDVLLEKLANRGDGTYVFIDSLDEADRVFGREMIATLQTIAYDAKIQVDFNPQRVRRYRLIGYENRAIADKDFRNDTIDAGEVGSGQSSTALYEVELAGDSHSGRPADLGTVYVRYRDAHTGQIEEISHRLTDTAVKRHTIANSPRFHLAACAAEFAEILRRSEHADGAKLDDVEHVLRQVCEQLPLDTRARELLNLITSAKGLPAAP